MRVEPQRPSQSGTTRVGMDGVIRRGPAGAPLDTRSARPAVQPKPVAAAPAPVARPTRPVARPTQQPMAAAQPAPAAAPASKAPRPPKRAHNGLRVFFQTLLALVVILGVAVAIVVLYLRYYQ